MPTWHLAAPNDGLRRALLASQLATESVRNQRRWLESRLPQTETERQQRVASRLLAARFRLVVLCELMRNEPEPAIACKRHSCSKSNWLRSKLHRAIRSPEVHVHRIGRTGHAGQKGLAPSLATMNDMDSVGNIEQMQADRQLCLHCIDGNASLPKDFCRSIVGPSATYPRGTPSLNKRPRTSNLNLTRPSSMRSFHPATRSVSSRRPSPTCGMPITRQPIKGARRS